MDIFTQKTFTVTLRGPARRPNRERLVQNDSLFHFNNVSVQEMETEIGRLNPSKATTFKNIPPKVLKGSSDIFFFLILYLTLDT